LNAAPLPSPARIRLRIGISGHRRPPKLPVWSEAPLRASIDRMFATVAACVAAGEVAVVSSLAEGADRITAEAGLAAGFMLCVVLPFRRAEYARDFETQASRTAFEALLDRAATVSELDGSGQDRPLAYEAAGMAMLAEADLLIAIWDGEKAAGRGGTAQIVHAALSGGIPVVWIDPGNPEAMRLAWPRGSTLPQVNAHAQPWDIFRPAGDAEIATLIKKILV
jgi:hypothetical protein